LLRKIDMEISRAPQFAFGCVAATLLDAINDLRNFQRGDREGRFLAAKLHSQRRKTAAIGRDFVASIYRREFIRAGGSLVHLKFVVTKMKSRPQLQLHGR